MRFRLSLLMFLQWAIPASLLPLYTMHLHKLGFNDRFIGICAASQAVAVVLSSLLTGQLADRWFSAEKSLSVCALLAGLDLWVLANLTQPVEVLLATLFFWLVVGPLLQLGVAIAFTHLPNAEKQFGPVRMWGTVGWMVMNWVAGYWLSDPGWATALLALVRPSCPQSELADIFRIGAFIALVVACFALTLPHTPPQKVVSPGRVFAPLAVLPLLRNRSFAIYCLCMFGLCITFPLTTQNTPLLLKQLGIPEQWVAPALTISQTTEIIALGLLPMILLRLGVRGTMLFGLCAWVLAMTILATGKPIQLVVASQGLNGFYVAGFLVAGQVYLNSQASNDLRASVQGLFNFVNGLGGFAGNLLASWLRELHAAYLPPSFAVGAYLTLGLLFIFVVGFWPRTPEQAGEDLRMNPPEEVP